MSNSQTNNKRIAKNTIVLYVRMFFSMLVGLYTSRVIIDALGVEDYGLYNLVGGFVIMFSAVQSGLVSASQRFINISLGYKDRDRLRHIFSTIMIIYIFLTILAFILVESIGVYFFDSHLNIPIERISAAKWTFHFSVITLIATLLGAPFNALIIAHERMQAFAYISIIDVIAKFLIAESVYFVGFDKLVVYSILLGIEALVIQFIYSFYCLKHFDETKIDWTIDWKLIKEIYSFAVWSMMGGFAFMGFTQGINVVLGMFFAPSVVAARGIANQVQSVVKNFANNFQTAVYPQIFKSYSSGDFDYFEKLLIVSSKYSYILLFVMSLPFIFEGEGILGLWLVHVPKDSALFLRLILFTILFDSMTTPYERAIHASGRVKYYSITTSLTFLSIAPMSYLVLKLGAESYSVFVVQLVITILAVFIRMYMAKKIVNVNLKSFSCKCLFPILKVSVLSVVPSLIVYYALEDGVIRLILVSVLSLISVLFFTYYFGMSNYERNICLRTIKSKLSFLK